METLIFIGFLIFSFVTNANKEAKKKQEEQAKRTTQPLPDYSRQFEGEEGWANAGDKKYVFGDITPAERSKPTQPAKPKKIGLDEVIRKLEMEMESLSQPEKPKPKPKKQTTPARQSIDYNSFEGKGSIEGHTSLAGFSRKEQEANKSFKGDLSQVAVSTNNDFDANREKNKEILDELRANPDGWRKAMIYSEVFGAPRAKRPRRVY